MQTRIIHSAEKVLEEVVWEVESGIFGKDFQIGRHRRSTPVY